MEIGDWPHFGWQVACGGVKSGVAGGGVRRLGSRVVAYRFEQIQRVEFSDTDMAGIVHFSVFFRYMERCEHAFYRSLGFSVFEQQPTGDDQRVGWPRVHVAMDYKAPLRFEEQFRVELWVWEVRRSTIRHGFRFIGVMPGAGSDESWIDNGLRATGELVIACVRKGSDGRMKAVEIPPHVRERLEVVPEEECRRLFGAAPVAAT